MFQAVLNQNMILDSKDYLVVDKYKYNQIKFWFPKFLILPETMEKRANFSKEMQQKCVYIIDQKVMLYK